MGVGSGVGGGEQAIIPVRNTNRIIMKNTFFMAVSSIVTDFMGWRMKTKQNLANNRRHQLVFPRGYNEIEWDGGGLAVINIKLIILNI
jgi:hypothetical protein